ncbi:uncharacterized protein BDW43DRAFT_258558 [Aspergillus alliaceus]|uniref:uncharacterized protein n=1 Tax=Petromyces alliaceus TaxID=209559 RepID=UPI0012A64C8C|nr:uncharacterized protein BDW43DRAFT_258558 [Aspergillus alliaceus]KAB8239587.1 hypothetical protein BDW43DRAFT_258558 [Aspergillus alliaceus]
MDNDIEKMEESTSQISTPRKALECMALFTPLTYIRLVVEERFSLADTHPFLYYAGSTTFHSILLYLYFTYR